MIGYELSSKYFPAAIHSVVYHDPDTVRDKIFSLTGDIEISIDVCNWCEIAVLDEIYSGQDFEVKIVE